MLCLGNDYKLLQVRNFAGLRKRQKRSFDRGLTRIFFYNGGWYV